MTTPDKIYATVLNGHVTMAWSDWREDKTDVEYIRADIHEAENAALKAENQSQFSAGVRAFFNALLFRTANNYHMNPEVNEKCTAENTLVERWAEDALKEVSPEDSDEWLRVCDLLENIGALKAENAAMHAECDRLTAMLGPQKPMSAKEMTEPGIYALYPHGHKTGGWVVALKSDSGKIFIRDVLGTGGLNLSSIKKGRFIGPIKPPEVSNA